MEFAGQPQLAQMLRVVTTESWTAQTSQGLLEHLGLVGQKILVWLFHPGRGAGVETVHVLTEESPTGEALLGAAVTQ